MSERELDIKAIVHGAQEHIKTELLSMIEEGTPLEELIYKLALRLEQESGEKGYASYVEQQLLAVYGLALRHNIPIERELQAIRDRLARIEEAYTKPEFTEEEKERMNFAIIAHKKNIARLEAMLD